MTTGTAGGATGDGEPSAPPISTVAGTGSAGFRGDGEPAASAQLNRPYGIAVDGSGTLYLSDFYNHRIRKVTTDGKISTVAGTGTPGFSGDGGPATSAQLSYPREVAVDSAGTVYVADANNHRIRKVTTDGKISTVAGTGTPGFSGDGGPATAARLHGPFGVTVDDAGVLFIAEYNNHRIRKVTANGKISTVAGTGTPGFGGDGGPAASAQLNGPHTVVVDGAGTLHVADYGNHRIRKITADGKISTVAGTGTPGFGGDGGPATAARLSGPVEVVVDGAGTLHVADYGNHRVRKVTADGKISTVAGTGTAGFGGDGGPAASAQLNYPFGLAVDCVDTLYVADHLNHRVRRVASARLAGLPESGTVVSWASVRSRLRMGVVRESAEDGAEVHQMLAVPRDHQRWRLVAAGRDDGEVLYRIESVRSGKVMEIAGAQEAAGAVVVQRPYEGADAHHQQWRLVPVEAADGTPRVYEVVNRNSGLPLSVGTNARTVVKQDGAEGDPRGRWWQLLPV
ncbi:RICIN domain-containing protein [Streptomyces somaliensis]|uniref:NHL domain-containing protein n=1 Tax=Streptomyces somaliensis TaxID=78355 RepID=UPI0020CF6CB4|nr:RICIN domain-containing protein [Streptomyces somaliensis]MCP9944063.1 RICIN domain-containing protein [Streptomyces somaliensis]MCP9962698.1 RICIN domain-containing protein [Streptomyces somaliensis]MCP9975534.1 RICIN domain-containing protein [Streptomyces somaliensis]